MSSGETTEGRSGENVVAKGNAWNGLPTTSKIGIGGLVVMVLVAAISVAIVWLSPHSELKDYVNPVSAFLGALGLAAALASRPLPELKPRHSTILYWVGVVCGVLGLVGVLWGQTFELSADICVAASLWHYKGATGL